jgi:hypothetical protein
MQRVAMTRDNAPGVELEFQDFGSVIINELDDVAFAAFAIDPFVREDYGTWSTAGGALHLMIGDNEKAPGTDQFFQTIAPVHGMTIAGDALIAGDINFPSFKSGYWSYSEPGNVELLVLEGDPAPGMPAGVAFSSGDPGLPTFQKVVFNNGSTLLSAFVSGPGVTPSNSLGLWSASTDDDLELVLRTGGQAPGAVPGALLSSIHDPAISGNRNLAFRGSLTGAQTGRGIWSGEIGKQLRMVALEGQSFQSNLTFQSINTAPGVSSAGVVFQAIMLAGLDVRDAIFKE